ncbi:unnamed protein product [Boreogadus saida]
MDQSSLASVLGHLAQTVECQTQLQQAQEREGHLAPPLSDRRPPIRSPRTGAAALQRDRPTPGPRARWEGGPQSGAGT